MDDCRSYPWCRLRCLQNQLDFVEKDIAKLKESEAAIELEMAKPEVYSNLEKLAEKNSRLEAVKSELAKLNTQWEEIFVQMD